MQPALNLILAAALALPLAAEISSLHPRIYVRHDDARIGKGTTVSRLRQRAKDPAWARWRGPAGTRPSALTAMERAARYLEEGNAEDLAAVREFLSTRTFSYEKNDVGGFLAGAETAIAFDWIYHGLSPEERAAVMANLVTTASSSERFLASGGADINHNYTYMALNAVAVCGLVLDGEPEPFGAKSHEYLALAKKYIEDPGRVLDTWNAREGAWAEGSHYTFHETVRTLILTLHAYRSATDADYFPLIRAEHGDFVRYTGRFLIGCTRPDMTFERTGDTSASRATASLTVPLTVEMIAAGVEDADEAARLRSFSRALLAAYGPRAVYSDYSWGMRIFWDPKDRVEPSYKTLPLFQRFGSGTYEQFALRDGWGPDSTLVTIVAGDHFTDHQHFDKGQFLIYRRGGLAVDSGAYDGMYKPGAHSSEYAPRTLAHNCLLVYDPAEAMPKGYSNDGGQLVIRGRQHHSTWQDYLDHREREALHAAGVTVFDAEAGRYAHIRVDLRRAYGDKVRNYERQFVYLPGAGTLVVFDRVEAAKPDFEKRWLLHLQEAPAIDGRTPEPGESTFSGARRVVARRTGSAALGGETVEYNGRMEVETLLPEKRVIAVTGGPGFEFYSPFTKTNYPVSNPATAAEIRESGRWRVDVLPAESRAATDFLNVIHVSQGGAAAPQPSRLVQSGEAAGALIGGSHVVMFAAGLPVEYRIDTAGAAEHLITGLPAQARVEIEVNGKPAKKAISNLRGVVRFADGAEGARTVVVKREVE